MCVLYTGNRETGPESLGQLHRLCDSLPPTVQKNDKGQAPCGQEEVEGVLFLTGDTTQCL